MTSDLILCIFAFHFFFQIRKMNKKWSFFFLFMGFSALTGGIYHGYPIIGEQYRYLSWVFLSISLIYAQLGAYSSIKNSAIKSTIIVKSTLLLSLSVYYGSFSFMILDTAISMLGFIVIGNLIFLKSLSSYISYGILISTTSAFFVIARISFHPDYFNYNDIGHYITILSLAVISKGVRKDYYTSHQNVYINEKG